MKATTLAIDLDTRSSTSFKLTWINPSPAPTEYKVSIGAHEFSTPVSSGDTLEYEFTTDGSSSLSPATEYTVKLVSIQSGIDCTAEATYTACTSKY